MNYVTVVYFVTGAIIMGYWYLGGKKHFQICNIEA